MPPHALPCCDCASPAYGASAGTPHLPAAAPHRAALLARRHPDLMHVEMRGGCVGPAAEGLPLEAAWDEKALAEMRQEMGKSGLEGATPGSARADFGAGEGRCVEG